jgi:hypothetical protein
MAHVVVFVRGFAKKKRAFDNNSVKLQWTRTAGILKKASIRTPVPNALLKRLYIGQTPGVISRFRKRPQLEKQEGYHLKLKYIGQT